MSETEDGLAHQANEPALELNNNSDTTAQTADIGTFIRNAGSDSEFDHDIYWDTPAQLKQLLEGALFASNRPVPFAELKNLFPQICQPCDATLKQVLTELEQDYSERAIRLQLLQQGYRFQVRTEASALVRAMLTEKPPKYSRASLETLALIAYRQPITRAEIEEVRGVSVSSQIMRTLEERGWIRVVGHKELPGRPALWATTAEFLDYFDLTSLEKLPPLAELRDLKTIEAALTPEQSAQLPVELEVETTAPTLAPEQEPVESIESEVMPTAADDILPDTLIAEVTEQPQATSDAQTDISPSQWADIHLAEVGPVARDELAEAVEVAESDEQQTRAGADSEDCQVEETVKSEKKVQATTAKAQPEAESEYASVFARLRRGQPPTNSED